jgi:hypothetical protein
MLTKGLWTICMAVMGVALVAGGVWAADAKPETKAEAKVDVKAEPKVETKAEPKVETKAEPKVEAKVEPKAEVKLNKAAETAVKEAFPKATLGEVEKEAAAGNTIFTVKCKGEKDAAFEVAVTSDGMILGVKSDVAEADVPAAVAKTAKAVEGAKVVKFEKIELRAGPSMSGDSVKIVKFEKAKVIFQATLEKDGKKGAQAMAEDGTPMGPVQWEEKAAPVAPKAPEVKPAETKVPEVAPVAPKAVEVKPAETKVPAVEKK